MYRARNLYVKLTCLGHRTHEGSRVMSSLLRALMLLV